LQAFSGRSILTGLTRTGRGEAPAITRSPLSGAWYRGPFEHNGSVATLEDWFDPRRLDVDYVPTGFRVVGAKSGRSQDT
jgi:hypothetical protein